MGCNSKQNDGGMLLHRVSDLCRQDCFHVSRSKDLMDLCKVQLVYIYSQRCIVVFIQTPPKKRLALKIKERSSSKFAIF